jgi:hypothetical protein
MSAPSGPQPAPSEEEDDPTYDGPYINWTNGFEQTEDPDDGAQHPANDSNTTSDYGRWLGEP